MPIDVDSWWNQNTSTTGASDGPVGSLINRVYLGEAGPKQVRMKRGGQAVTIPAGDKTLGVSEAKRKYLTDEALRSQWNVTLRKLGLDADPIQARAIWDLAVDGASDWYATSQGQQKITPEQYITWYSSGKTKKPKADLTRQIYNVTPEQIDTDINDVAQKVLGRTITDADKQADWYGDLVKGITKMASRGTTTEVETVRNKKTGKLEKRVIQTPEVTKEAITERITSAVEEADPLSLQRKKDLDFENWFLKNTRGRG